MKKNGSKITSIYGRKTKTSPSVNIGLRYPRSVLKFETVNSKNHGHPTEKPQALFEWLIRTYTNAGDLVLDNCVGSGTTAVAAEHLNRRWIAIEKEEEYCKIAQRRLSELEQNNDS